VDSSTWDDRPKVQNSEAARFHDSQNGTKNTKIINWHDTERVHEKLIRRWDSERELYDDILHPLQSTIDSCINSGTDIGHAVFTLTRKQQETATTVKRNLNDKLQVSNGEIHSTSNAWIELRTLI